ncbi:MAG: ion transporter [bacterium]
MNYFFSACFVTEAILKIYVLKYENYINNSWNKLDMFVVSISILEIILNNINLTNI